jgi:hypothetical protein
MEVPGGQQFGTAVLQPVFARHALTLGTVAVAAGVDAGQGMRLPVRRAILSKDAGQTPGLARARFYGLRLALRALRSRASRA